VLSLFFLWQETDYWWFPVFLVVVTPPCFCRVGFDTITPNWFKYVECSSRDNGKSRVPSPNEEAGIILGGRHRCGRLVTFVTHRRSDRVRRGSRTPWTSTDSVTDRQACDYLSLSAPCLVVSIFIERAGEGMASQSSVQQPTPSFCIYRLLCPAPGLLKVSKLALSI